MTQEEFNQMLEIAWTQIGINGIYRSQYSGEEIDASIGGEEQQ